MVFLFCRSNCNPIPITNFIKFYQLIARLINCCPIFIQTTHKHQQFLIIVAQMQLVTWIAKQTGKISDRFNDYKFYVKQQPQIIDSSSTVCIQTFDSRDMTASIPCSFRWFTIPHFRGNTYICEPADVGCLLQVEITSSDPECKGTAVMTYGPVKFDVLLKKQIQMALTTGESIFLIDVGENNSTKQCHLRLEQQRMSIHHIPSSCAFTFDYNLIQPKVQILPKIPTRVRIIFNPKYYDQLQRFLSRLFNRQVFHQQITRNPFLQLTLNNRKARDSFVLIVKAFNTKKLLKTTTYVSNLQKQLDFTKITQKDQAKTIDYLQHISQLNYDINKLIEINGKNYMQKRLYLQETKRLQKEFQEAVSTYVKIIEEKFEGRQEFEKSFVVLKEKEEEIRLQRDQKFSKGKEELQHKLMLLQEENRQLKHKIDTMHNNNSPPLLHSATVPLSTSITNSPFKRKTILQTESPSSKNFIQTPSFQPILKPQEESNLRQSLHEMTVKYEAAIREIEQLKAERMQLSSPNNNNRRNQQQQMNLDNFEARSVKSVKHNNTNNNMYNILRSPSNVSSSLLLSNHTSLINPQRLKFPTPTNQSLLKPLSPQSSLQSYPIISALQHQNATLKQQLHQLQKIIQQLTQKQHKYKKRISQLTEQLQMHKRNNDVLNRSQHLSMEMEEYNESQNNALKEENAFLKKEIEHSQALCLKYKAEIKKFKHLDKSLVGDKSLVLSEANLQL